jgi:hypothetical protein
LALLPLFAALPAPAPSRHAAGAAPAWRDSRARGGNRATATFPNPGCPITERTRSPVRPRTRSPVRPRTQVSAAIQNAEVVVAVTARARKYAPPSIYPRDLESIVASLTRGRRAEPGESRGATEAGTGEGGAATGGAGGHGEHGGLAVLFGSERSGLTSDQLSTANFLLHIPSFPGFGCVSELWGQGGGEIGIGGYWWGVGRLGVRDREEGGRERVG